MRDNRYPEVLVLVERTRAKMKMNAPRGCHRRAIRLHVVLDSDHPVPKGCPSLVTALAEKNVLVPARAPILIDLDHHHRSRPHQNGTLSLTHLESLGRRYLVLQGLQVHLYPQGAEWLHR